jgi:hypothetical protein
MTASEWVASRLRSLQQFHSIVWTDDPYCLLEAKEAEGLRTQFRDRGAKLLVVHNALRLREALQQFDPILDSPKVVIVDQSYTLRDPSQLPKDAKPSDLRPLAAPDWKSRIAAEARFRPTVRGFLVNITEFQDWPPEVDIFPYEKLARERAGDFIGAYRSFRRTGRNLTDVDLVLVGASAVLGVDLFSISDPIAALDLAFHRDETWNQLMEFFNLVEREVIRKNLANLPEPLGDLFSDRREIARIAVTGLLILKQHFPDPGRELAQISSAFATYSNCDLPTPRDVPGWFREDEVPRFEKWCTKDFLGHLHAALNLNEPDSAKHFVERERYSKLFLSRVPFELQEEAATADRQGEDFGLDHLVPEFRKFKRELEGIVGRLRRPIENLRLKRIQEVTAADILKLFVDERCFEIERLVGRLETLIQFIEVPARRQWKNTPGFENRWTIEAHDCRDTIALAARLRNELDLAFGRLMESRYAELVPAEIPTTDLFYEKWMAPRRRTVTDSTTRAVVVVVDSMRFDIWRGVLRPALERDYEVEEALGFAILPSMTHFSRRAFFAGKPPALLTSGKESDLFAELLGRVHGRKFEFDDLPGKHRGAVFAVRSRGPEATTFAAVFDAPDALSHGVDWDPHVLHASLRNLVTEIRALLQEAGPDALVFITSDHGHVRLDGASRVDLPGAENVGYRSAYALRRIEGHAASRIFQIPAQALRHSLPGNWLFPRPGFALFQPGPGKYFRPDENYRHGGSSLLEVIVPIVCLRHRKSKVKVTISATAPTALQVGLPSEIGISVAADGALTSALMIACDEAAVESAVVDNVGPTPQTVRVRFTPSAPGRQRLVFRGVLGGEGVAEHSLDVQIASAAVEQDAARAKLSKLFGED